MTALPAGSASLHALRAALIETGYQEHARAARSVRGTFARADAVPAVVRQPGPGGRLAGLLELFAYGAELDDRSAVRALAPATPAALTQAGLLQRRASGWRARLSIGGHGDVFVVGDIRRRGQHRDYVDGVTNAADVGRRLFVPLGPGQRLLDLGTGSGIHALLAARAGGSAVGADINARALRLASIGQQLSDVDDVQWRHGSWYAPVAGERFDRIICVAPYVVSPDNEFTFRDGDRAGEDPLRTVAAGAAAHLGPGGCAQVMCCWGHGAAEDWRRTPMSWVAPRGADVLLLRLEEADPVRYALAWNRPPMRVLGPVAHDRVMARWLSYYAQEGYDQISFAALYIRRRAGGGRTGVSRAVLDAREGVGGERGGEQVGRALANLELLAGRRDDDALLGLAPAIPEGQRVEQRLQHDGQRYRLRRASIRLAGGLGVRVDVTAQVLEVVYRLDGRRSVAQALADVGVGRGAAARARTAETVSAVRELLRAGLLEVGADG